MSPDTARDKFFEVASSQARIRVIPDPAKPRITPEQQAWSDFHDWAKSDDTKRYVALMTARKAEYRALENANIDNHAKLAYFKAWRDFCEAVEQEINAWAAHEPPIGAPHRPVT